MTTLCSGLIAVEDTSSSIKKTKPPRCLVCKKKVLLPMTCKCGSMFCIPHCLPEVHSCTIDYKTIGKELLKENNPVVQVPKIDKI